MTITKKQQEMLDTAQEMLEASGEELSVIVLISGHLEDNTPHYAYAKIDSKKYISFKTAELEGNYNLMDYAEEILASGPGLSPSKEVQKEMEEKYGSCSFESEILKRFSNS